MPFLVTFSFLAVVSLGAESVIFVRPSFSHWEQATAAEGAGGGQGYVLSGRRL